MRVRSSSALEAIAAVMCFVPLPLAIAIALAIVGEPSIARASERDADVDAARVDAAAPIDDSSSWRPILAGCLGVLFGAAIAAWHIRGRGRA